MFNRIKNEYDKLMQNEFIIQINIFVNIMDF